MKKKKFFAVVSLSLMTFILISIVPKYAGLDKRNSQIGYGTLVDGKLLSGESIIDPNLPTLEGLLVVTAAADLAEQNQQTESLSVEKEKQMDESQLD